MWTSGENLNFTGCFDRATDSATRFRKFNHEGHGGLRHKVVNRRDRYRRGHMKDLSFASVSSVASLFSLCPVFRLFCHELEAVLALAASVLRKTPQGGDCNARELEERCRCRSGRR